MVVAIIIFGLTVLMINFFADARNLKKENNELISKNEELQKKLDVLKPSKQEQERRKYLNVAKQFVETAINMNKINYASNREKARDFMGEELYDIFFSSENFPYSRDYRSEALDASYFLQAHKPLDKEIYIIVRYTGSLKFEGRVPEKTDNAIELKLEKVKDKWIVTSIDEIKMEII